MNLFPIEPLNFIGIRGKKYLGHFTSAAPNVILTCSSDFKSLLGVLCVSLFALGQVLMDSCNLYGSCDSATGEILCSLII
jgi:hypothetical protein